jgi:hypothetical protein
MTKQDYVALEGSHRDAPPDPRLCAAPPQEIIKVTVHLRGRGQQQLERRLASSAQAPANARRHLTRDEFAEQHGARPADIAGSLRATT